MAILLLFLPVALISAAIGVPCGLAAWRTWCDLSEAPVRSRICPILIPTLGAFLIGFCISLVFDEAVQTKLPCVWQVVAPPWGLKCSALRVAGIGQHVPQGIVVFSEAATIWMCEIAAMGTSLAVLVAHVAVAKAHACFSARRERSTLSTPERVQWYGLDPEAPPAEPVPPPRHRCTGCAKSSCLVIVILLAATWSLDAVFRSLLD